MEAWVLSKLVKYRRKAYESGWCCMYGSCNKKSINSHIIQKGRYLEIISGPRKKLYAREYDYFNGNKFVFKERGLNQILSFPGFCTEHDHKIFRKIEHRSIDFEDWVSLHLLCYRTTLNERRKKEINIRWSEAIFDDKVLSYYLDVTHLKDLEKGMKMGIADLNRTVSRIVDDVNNGVNTTITHFFRVIPYEELCVCGTFNLQTTADRYYRQLISGKPYDYVSPIFIHLIPIDTKNNCLIISWEVEKDIPVKKYLDKLFNGTSDEVYKQVSDLLFLQVENWVCSKAFFDRNIKHRENYILELIKNTSMAFNESDSLNFNLFKI